ncbi:MAG: hypothetical protein ACYDBJ_08795 [Aggregatilineales bacterium]
MRSAISQALHLLNRRSRSGQSIIIIALGFIGLVAFVGIATDTAILFVRYSTLHRAVDAAAIAAAGAARQSTSFAALGAVAEEYIKIHGLQPSSVRVDDCATEIDDWLNSQGYPELPTGTHSDAENLVGFKHFTSPPQNKTEQLCTLKPQKLVRVEAQIDSQTTFLSLIGFPTVRLSASSVSQTASLDVALLIDASYSESYDTAAAQSGQTAAALDNFQPFLGYFNGPASNPVAAPILDGYSSANPSGAANSPTAGTHPYGSIRAECRQIADLSKLKSQFNGSVQTGPAAISQSALYPTNSNYYYGGCCNEPVTFSNPPSPSQELDWYIYSSDPTKPYYNLFNVAHLKSGMSPMDTGNPDTGGGHFSDRNYSTLICKPFKYVRDAARDFLNHFDFNGGDRAMLITYDDTVHELTSKGEYNNPSDAGSIGGAVPVFSDKASAIIALNKYAGVEISPTGYHASCLAPLYPPYSTNGRFYAGNTQPADSSGVILLYETASSCTDTNTGGAVLAGQSLLTNPNWIRRDSVWVMVILSDGYPNRTPGLSAVCGSGDKSTCGTAINGGQSPSIHKINSPGDLIYGTPPFGDTTNYMPNHGQNFFGQIVPYYTPPPGLTTFPYPPQTTVWDSGNQPISILTQKSLEDPGFCPWNTFCDPTGGGYLANQGTYQNTLTAAQLSLLYPDGNLYTYPENASNGQNGTPDATHNTPNAWAYNQANCPAGDVQSPQEPIWWATDISTTLKYSDNGSPGKIACTSYNPDARHFCMNTSGVIDPASTTGPYQAASDPSICSIHYDAADYARDQVDFAALTDFTSTTKGNSVAMYGIFFPHQTGNYPNGDIGPYILGAKFMRYVADAGDNGTIDNHVQNWYRQHIVGPLPYQTDPVPPSYNGGNSAYPPTAEDPCAPYDFQEGVTGNPSPGSHQAGNPSGPYAQYGQGYEDLYKYNCGNYYYAGSTAAVDQAFLNIAGRLFTRLAH